MDRDRGKDKDRGGITGRSSERRPKRKERDGKLHLSVRTEKDESK